MVNNKKINNYYRKKNSPQRNKSQDNDVTEAIIATTNHHVRAPNENQVNTVKMDNSESPKQSSLATAATSQVAGSNTGKGVVRKILGSVVIGEGTTTMVTDIGVSVPVITQATSQLVDTSMESGLFSEEESGQTKLMSYEADHSADELDTMDGENDFMNLSGTPTTVNASGVATQNNQGSDNDMNTTLGEQLINISMIQQEPEVQTQELTCMGTTSNLASAILPIVNTISPDKNNEFKAQVCPTNAKQQSSSGESINDDGFTVIQRTRKVHQKSALDHLKNNTTSVNTGYLLPQLVFGIPTLPIMTSAYRYLKQKMTHHHGTKFFVLSKP
jgi:hypothetical protein